MWYGDRYDLSFPKSWQVQLARMRGGPDIGDEGIRAALARPIGSPPLRELARGRRDAVILVDDLTRPTPAYRTVPYLLEELAAAGLGDDRVRIVIGLGCHRALTRDDMMKKLGADLVERLHVVNHNTHDNLEFIGVSSHGVPVWVNRYFAQADLKIAAGMITPRGPFFGGGSKLVMPGVSGYQTIYSDHARCPPVKFRRHLDEVSEMVGLDFIANPLLSEELGIMAMVTGDPKAAFRRGVEIGERLYATDVPESVDVVVCNAWPKDTEGTMAGLSLQVLRQCIGRALKKGGSLVITTAASEGLCAHKLLGPGTRLRLQRLANPRADTNRVDILVSPNLHREDVRLLYGEKVRFCKTWPEALARLESKHHRTARVCVFPTGGIQYGIPPRERLIHKLLRAPRTLETMLRGRSDGRQSRPVTASPRREVAQ
jgi:hypothetical protein